MTNPRTGDAGVRDQHSATTTKADRDSTADPAHLSQSAPDSAILPLWRQAVAASKEASQARRSRVLAHPDLVQRLTHPPLRLSDPARWSGWIPPRLLAEDACTHCDSGKPRPLCSGWPHRSRVNESPVRRQLVDISAEAMRREATS